jgi:hypothetical protein
MKSIPLKFLGKNRRIFSLAASPGALGWTSRIPFPGSRRSRALKIILIYDGIKRKRVPHKFCAGREKYLSRIFQQ